MLSRAAAEVEVPLVIDFLMRHSNAASAGCGSTPTGTDTQRRDRHPGKKEEKKEKIITPSTNTEP